MNTPLEKEVGGSHYQKYVMQPVELFIACGWNYCQSNIAKYVLRHQDKNGKEDLEKAIHICDIAIRYNHTDKLYEYRFREPIKSHPAMIQTFVRVNKIDEYDMDNLLYLIDTKAYVSAKCIVIDMLKKHYNVDYEEII